MKTQDDLLDLLCYENDAAEQRFIDTLEQAIDRMKTMQSDHGLQWHSKAFAASSARGYLYWTSIIGHEIVEAIMEERESETKN